jgi:anti-sigma regulatory factor (Ser/Thr protein kinase)
MRRHPVEHDVDVFGARRAAREVAEAVGFSRVGCVEIVIVASELASNILKYGVRGSVQIEIVDDPARGEGLRITAFDEGAPFQNFDGALRDGFDDTGPIDVLKLGRRGGIGAGLGAVRRLTDEIGWAPTSNGKRVWAVRFRERPRDRVRGS